MGVVYTWGGGSYGKLGQSDTMNSPTPRPVENVGAGAHFCQVQCGTFHTLALTKLGDVYSWGFNGNGRLGLAEPGGTDTAPRLTPVLIKKIEGLACKDDTDVGLPMDESQAATTALVKALRPKQARARLGPAAISAASRLHLGCISGARARARRLPFGGSERPRQCLHVGRRPPLGDWDRSLERGREGGARGDAAEMQPRCSRDEAEMQPR